jgi:hypothetical protein
MNDATSKLLEAENAEITFKGRNENIKPIKKQTSKISDTKNEKSNEPIIEARLTKQRQARNTTTNNALDDLELLYDSRAAKNVDASKANRDVESKSTSKGSLIDLGLDTSKANILLTSRSASVVNNTSKMFNSISKTSNKPRYIASKSSNISKNSNVPKSSISRLLTPPSKQNNQSKTFKQKSSVSNTHNSAITEKQPSYPIHQSRFIKQQSQEASISSSKPSQISKSISIPSRTPSQISKPISISSVTSSQISKPISISSVTPSQISKSISNYPSNYPYDGSAGSSSSKRKYLFITHRYQEEKKQKDKKALRFDMKQAMRARDKQLISKTKVATFEDMYGSKAKRKSSPFKK